MKLWYYIPVRTLLNRYLASKLIGQLKEADEYEEYNIPPSTEMELPFL